jgi:hypothetical protein
MTVKNITGERTGNFYRAQASKGPEEQDLPYFRSYIPILKPKTADF